MGFNCLKAAEPLRGSLLLNNKNHETVLTFVNIIKIKLQGVKILQNIFTKNLSTVLKGLKKT